MLNIRRLLGFLNRRKRDKAVEDDRRGDRRSRMEKADDSLRDAFKDFEKTVSINRDKLLKFSANDIQQEVQFITFRDICSFGYRQGAFALCRHPRHEAANTGIAPCGEGVCPIILGRTA